MITESFGPRALANMEFALESGCQVLAVGSEKHTARRHIASRIIESRGS